MVNNKKIVIVSAVFPPEPVVSAQISYDLAKELSNNFPVVVLCPVPTRPNGRKFPEMDFFNEPFSRIVLNSYTHPQSDFIGRMRESWDFGKLTARYIDENHEEIGCVYMNTWPIWGQYLALNALTKYKIPSIVHIQDIYPESMLPRLGILGNLIGMPLRLLDRIELTKASFCFAISENMKKYMSFSRNISLSKIEVIRNWQDDSLFVKDDQREKCNKFTFMFVGSISPAADVLFLIQSFICANLDNARLVIAGDGSDKQKCIDFAKKYPEKDISFCNVSPQTVPLVQKEADVLLLSLRKGLGVTASPSKLPAYMFSAKPVLASVDHDTDVEYVIRESKGGWVCSAEDRDELICKMKYVMSLPKETLIEKGLSAQQYALSHFTRDINLKKMIEKIKLIYRND